jgi:hypothetical protein
MPRQRKCTVKQPALGSPSGSSPRSTALAVGELFFPQSKCLGIDRTQFSPSLQAKIVFAGSNETSYDNAAQALQVLAELEVDGKQVRRLCLTIGAERVQERDAEVAAYREKPLAERKSVPDKVAAPTIAVVGVDGGRLQIFERGQKNMQLAQEVEAIEDDVAIPEAAAKATTKKPLYWREDKIGLFMTAVSDAHASDPCPTIPESFLNANWIPELAKQLGKHGVASEPVGAVETSGEKMEFKPPEITSKELLATRRPWSEFGPMVAARAWALGFYGAARRAFLGDGAENNWTVWRTHFSSFVPILDFIHALIYVFHSAQAGRGFADGWTVYQRWIGWLWGGEIEKLIAELAQRQVELGQPADKAKPTDPALVVSRALSYLQNNKDRMRYATYRQQGLPIVSSYVESAVKEFNYRVKGTEKFWRENGAEDILQLRADYLSDSKPMDQFWKRRQLEATGQNPYRVHA